MRTYAARSAAIALAGFLAMPLAAAGETDDARHAAVAAEIVELTMADLLVEQMGDAIWPTVEADLRASPGPTDETLIAALREAFDVTLAQLVENASDGVVAFYVREFSHEELTALRDFYLSPAGARMIAVGPRLTAEVMPTMMSEAQRLLPQALEEIMARAEAEAATPAKR